MVNGKKTTIGERIVAYRKALKLNRREFLELLSDSTEGEIMVHEGTLAKIESYGRFPTTGLLVALDCVGIATPDEVLFGGNRLPICSIKEDVDTLAGDKFEEFYQACEDTIGSFTEDAVTTEDTAKELDKSIHPPCDCSLRLREIRKAQGLTQVKAAELLGVDHNTVFVNERSAFLPQGRYLSYFCSQFNVSASYIIDAYNSLPERLVLLQSLLAAYSYNTQKKIVEFFTKELNRVLRD